MRHYTAVVGIVMLCILADNIETLGQGVVPAPDEPGSFAVGYQVFRERTGFSLWYPAAPTGEEVEARYSRPRWAPVSLPARIALDSPPVAREGPYPLVVYQPGFGANAFMQAPTAEYLASHGFVVVSMDSNSQSHVATIADMFEALQAEDFENRVLRRFDSELLNIIDPDLSSQVDTKRIGVSGISLGAHAAVLAAAGERADPRIKAILPIDGSPSQKYDPPMVPSLTIGSGPSLSSQLHGLPRYQVSIKGYAHVSSGDVCWPQEYIATLPDVPEPVVTYYDAYDALACPERLIDNSEAIRLTSLYTVAFFRSTLAQDERYRQFLSHGYAPSNEPDVARFYAIGIVPGDINGDGVFGQRDVDRLLRFDKFTDRTSGGEHATALWHEGDFDGNGRFDQLDLVFALSETPYDSTGQRAVVSIGGETGTSGPREAIVTPEPSSLLLALLGIIGLLHWRR